MNQNILGCETKQEFSISKHFIHWFDEVKMCINHSCILIWSESCEKGSCLVKRVLTHPLRNLQSWPGFEKIQTLKKSKITKLWPYIYIKNIYILPDKKVLYSWTEFPKSTNQQKSLQCFLNISIYTIFFSSPLTKRVYFFLFYQKENKNGLLSL